jgi:hypothetical protein
VMAGGGDARGLKSWAEGDCATAKPACAGYSIVSI